jgi:hypothetical protein
MNNDSIPQLKRLINAAMARLHPMKSIMREDELEDVDYYESFDIAHCKEKKIVASIHQRLTNIEARLLKKQNAKVWE